MHSVDQSSRDIFESLLYVLIGFLALFGNCVVLYTICKHPRLQNSFNVFVASLAIVDICNAALSVPITVTKLLTNWHPGNKFLCLLPAGFFCFVTILSLMYLSLMTTNRYYRVAKPAKFQEIFTIKRSLVLSILSATISAIISATIMGALTPITQYAYNHLECFRLEEPLVGLFVYLFAFVGPPSVFVVFFYFKTRRLIHKPRASAVYPATTSGVPNFHLYVEEATTLKVLLILFVSSYCCLISANVFWLLDGMISNAPHYVLVLEFVFRYLSNVNIPIVYVFGSKFYRKELYKLLFCKSVS